MANCTRLAHEGARDGPGPAVGRAYDALIRKRWSDWAAAGMPDFDADTTAASIDYNAVRIAAAQR
eukprot:11222372-Lingulodinium_polyedra.AAC.1